MSICTFCVQIYPPWVENYPAFSDLYELNLSGNNNRINWNIIWSPPHPIFKIKGDEERASYIESQVRCRSMTHIIKDGATASSCGGSNLLFLTVKNAPINEHGWDVYSSRLSNVFYKVNLDLNLILFLLHLYILSFDYGSRGWPAEGRPWSSQQFGTV